MKVGFTGSRHGWTPNQRSQFWSWLERQDPTEFHHGCCKGADESAANVAYLTTNFPVIVGHPGTDKRWTSEIALDLCGEVRDPKPNLQRNRDIVSETVVLAACPSGPEELRSGTWATVRFARKAGRWIVFFWPDGEVTEDKPQRK